MALPLSSTTQQKVRPKIMVVEDCDTERCLLTSLLDSMGYQTLAFSDAKDALCTLKQSHIDMVITDWMMPEISGIDLCKTIKSMTHPPYTILLTGNNQNSHLIEGIEAGADDFVTKPFNVGVLKVRVLAGLRIVEMQQALAQQNSQLNALLSKEQQYLKDLQQDLASAAQLQRALLPKNADLTNGWQVTTRFKPAQELAGDIFQCFNIDSQHIGFYLLDVSGHGTAASMLSFTLAQQLSSSQKAWQQHDLSGLVNKVNRKFEDPEQCGRFATLLIGIANTHTAEIELISAGHPAPIVVGPLGTYFIDNNQLKSQLPIGISKVHQYQSQIYQLEDNCELLLYSDGLYECRHSKYGFYGQDKLLKNIHNAKSLPANRLLHYLSYSAELWQEKQAQDDISLMLISSTKVDNRHKELQ
ncbi:hypothetical protein TUM4438_42420 [Shewanella sairae]|uniref:Response regulatory domain-containing protein n=1 Tax=Shewanella sairae TaxID=190310 RepID=A0ABQ4PQX9_9GAMM|nr:SpoIIE family protein phosphatase [Shewanella sairae]MCL1131392.1 SpoIIE family protein phosphatase [Shewanella sairae]GIU51737.1 hypothetical protein TUM4438_42420 [Shewanella sairae]